MIYVSMHEVFSTIFLKFSLFSLHPHTHIIIFFCFAGRIYAKYIEYQRSIFIIIEHAINSLASHINGIIIGTTQFRLWIIVWTTLWNGKNGF